MIVLMRHGEAEPYSGQDSSRPLTERGREQATLTGRWLREQNLPVSHIVASPYLRAQQSAQRIADSLELDVVTVRDITPDKSEATAEAALVDHMGAVVCFHQPILGRLLHRWTGQRVSVNTGACFVLHGDLLAPDWMSLSTQFDPS